MATDLFSREEWRDITFPWLERYLVTTRPMPPDGRTFTVTGEHGGRVMNARTHVENYLNGLATNDPGLFLPAMAEYYLMDDPNSAVIPKARMAEFMHGFAALVSELRGGATPLPLLEFSDRVERIEDDELVVWLWWRIPGTVIQGAGLIRAGADGVRAEKLAYFTKLVR
jgi:hypothetical protein